MKSKLSKESTSRNKVGAADIQSFVDKSDFAFELEVLHELQRLGIKANHAGLYTDPSTDIAREFDLRVDLGAGREVHLAMECKNLREDFPLLVQCVPRVAAESFHQIIYNAGGPVAQGRSYTHNMHATKLYPESDPVGKAFAQVGTQNSNDTCSDPKFYDKFAQAMQSTAELVNDARERGNEDATKRCHFVLPVVVVPNDRLWQVDYGVNGTQRTAPHLKPHISYKINKSWSSGHFNHTSSAFTDFLRYKISHMEFVEKGYLEVFFETFLGKGSNFDPIFTAAG